MAETEIHLVNVYARRQAGDVPVKQIWAAATSRDRAVAAVKAKVPGDWTAELSHEVLTPSQAAGITLKPGEVAEVGAAFRR